MNYILKGDPKEVAKVLQENRIRVDRGVIAFTPCQPDAAPDADSIATLREDLDAKTKSCMEMAASQIELACIIDELVDVIAENGIVISEDLAARLAQFGITVPESAKIVPNTVEIADKAGESVPDTVPTEDMGDNKNVDADDVAEVNLDDVKDAPGEDSKAAPAPTPKKSRSKKSK